MNGEKIAILNKEMEVALPLIIKQSNEGDVQVKIAVLEFSDDARWITPNKLIEIEYFRWFHLKAGGQANFGAACKELNDKLSNTAFMSDYRHSFVPIIIFISGGDSTNGWKEPLMELKNNKWFKSAIKTAIVVGEDADIDLLAKFTGNKDAVKNFHSNFIHSLIKEAIKSIFIWLDLPIEHEDDELMENQLQMIFNRRINRSQIADHYSGKDKGDLNNKFTNQVNRRVTIENVPLSTSQIDDDWV
jgi:uncharacterized protein YegL